tara:strand:- start:102 stop:1283 length:1182 start_codon:yes stop_codon:yes gene_type:complete
MTQTLIYENLTNQSGQSVQSDVEVDGADLLLAASDITGIELSITWDNQSSWQGCECYVIDPDGSYHYIFNSGSLPFGSGTRTDTLQINSGSFPSSVDGTWEFYLSDQMFGTVTLDEVSVELQVTSANMPATYGENLWWNGEAYQGGIDLTNNSRHLYPQNGASIVASTGSGGTHAFSFDGVNDVWSDGGNTGFDNLTTCSWSCWVNPSSLATKGMIYCNHGYRKGNWQIYLSGATVNLFIGYYDPGFSSSDAMRVYANTINSTNTWYHIAITFDGSQSLADRVKIYIDDQPEVTTVIEYGNGVTAIPNGSVSGQPAPQAVGGLVDVSLAGAPSGTIRYPLNGLADDCRAFPSYVLTSSDITWLESARGVAGGPPASFKSYFRTPPSIVGFPNA